MDEDTEWNDILRAHGILPPKKNDDDALFEELDREISEAQDERLDEKTLEELDELEDDEDERVLAEYRKKRLAEMKEQAARERFGELVSISKPDFVREVTDVSYECPVVVALYKDPIPACKVLLAHLATLASRHRSTKFVKIVGDQCIPGYPDRNMPTLLVYADGDVRKQVVGVREFGGVEGINTEVLEQLLVSAGALDPPPERSSTMDRSDPSSRRVLRGSKTGSDEDADDDDDDDDWD